MLAAGLGAIVTVSASGCTGNSSRPAPEPPRPDPDDALRSTVVAEKRELIETYAATVRRHPGLRRRLAGLQADHDAHLAAIGGSATATGAASPAESTPPATSTPPADASTGSPATSPPVPADPVAAIRSLARFEQAAAGRRIGQCVRAADAELAPLIASIGACEAAHAALLRGGAP